MKGFYDKIKDMICDQCKCGTSTISSQNENENNDEAILTKKGFSMEIANADLTSYRKIEAEFKSKFKTVQEARLEDINKMFNPWLSKHHHKSEDEELLEVPSEEYEIKPVSDTGCTIRSFKNATMYSSSEFIHEYINYKKCIADKKGNVYKHIKVIFNGEGVHLKLCLTLSILLLYLPKYFYDVTKFQKYLYTDFMCSRNITHCIEYSDNISLSILW